VLKGPGERFAERLGFGEERRRAGLSSLELLSARDLGEPVTDRRSSWVRRTTIGSSEVYIKTYDYPGAGDLMRGLLRTTWLAPSRARREWDALLWMRAEGLPAPEPLALAERRWHGVLRRAVLVTQAYPGQRMDQLLLALSRGERDGLLRALEAFVEGLHRRGFRDGNLDLRNLLARRVDDDPSGAWEIVKIDSPRHRLLRPGPAHDRRARADWDRLAASLREAGLRR
jgi:hypothetical protein